MVNICSQTKKGMEDELQSCVGMVEAKVATLNSKFGPGWSINEYSPSKVEFNNFYNNMKGYYSIAIV